MHEAKTSRRPSWRAGAAATAVLFATACVDRYSIPANQLAYLNGYDIHSEQNVNGVTFTDRPYRLLTAQGEVVDYNSSKQLYLFGDGGQQLAPPGPFANIYVTEDAFDAVPLAGQAFGVPLASVSSVEVVEPNSAKTATIITVFSIAMALIPTIIVSTSHGSTPAAAVAPHHPALK